MERPDKVIDRVFSRDVLGSILLGGSISKVVEKTLNIVSGQTVDLLILWMISSILFLMLFIYWDRVESTVEEATDISN